MLGDGKCNTTCNNKGCAYDFGDCEYPCEAGCLKCFKDEGITQCLECVNDYFLLYTRCISECPSGFTPTIKLGRKVCEPLPDYFDMGTPKVIYVSQDRSREPSSQTGDFDSPFGSLSVALSHIRNKNIKILLMNFDGTDHILDIIDIRQFPESRLSKPYSPLDFGSLRIYEYMEIMPLTCDSEEAKYCYMPGDRAKVRWSGLDAIEILIYQNVWITDVDFNGYNTITQEESDYENEYSTYCPYVTQDGKSGSYHNDKGEKITWKYAKQSDCDRYKDFNLFRVISGALSISNSVFSNWRAGFFSIISSKKGSIYLVNVDFINIITSTQPFSAIISSYECEFNSYSCGVFRYDFGNVKLLNNGFEYNDNIFLSGFIYAVGLETLGISNVNFEENMVYKGRSVVKQSYDSAGSLIFLQNFFRMEIYSCSFRNIIVDKILYLKMLTNYDINQHFSQRAVLKADNIQILSNLFENIYGDILDFYFNAELPTMTIESNRFDRIIYNQDMIKIYLNLYNPIFFTGGFYKSILENGEIVKSPYKARHFYLRDTQISNCYGAGRILHFENLVMININFLSIHNSLENQAYDTMKDSIQNIVYDNLISSNNYISKQLNSGYLDNNLQHFGNACYLYGIRSIEIGKLILSYNYSMNGATDFYMENLEKRFKAESIEIYNNIASFQDAGAGISFMNPTIDIQLESVIARNNTNPLGYGALYYKMKSAKGFPIKISNSSFIENYAAYGSAIAISSHELEVMNVLFERNSVIGSYGGAIYFNHPSLNDVSYFNILNSTFLANSAEIGLGGAIVIDNSMNYNGELKLVFEDCKFLNNTSSSDASILYISRSVQIHQDSSILSCSFEYNRSDKKGNILLAYRMGVLTFDKCTFYVNESDQGIIMYIISSPETSDRISRVIVRNSTFENNRPYQDIYSSLIHVGDSVYASTLETSSNLFQNNIGASIKIDYGNWIEYNSTFINNKSIQAAVARISNGGKADLRDLEVSNNLSSLRGGAFILISMSTLRIRNSNITRNKSLRDGGVIYMENDSVLLIENSVIAHNQAENKGSILYSTECSIENSHISNSKISDNISKNGGIISLMNSYLRISDSEIHDNLDENITPGILITSSVLNVENTQFRNQRGLEGAGIYSTSQSILSLTSCSFKNLYANSNGGAISSYYSTINIINSNFENLFAQSAGSIFAYSKCKIDIRDSVFSDSYALLGGGIIKSFGSQLITHNSTFHKFNSTGIEADTMSNFEIYDSRYTYGVGVTGGAINCIRCSGINISNSEFLQNVAQYGGAIHITTSKDSLISTYQIIYNNSFEENSALSGGSVYSNNLNLDIYGNTFDRNIAILSEDGSEGNGGAISMECYDVTECEFNIFHNTFLSNSASRNGGSIYWKHFLPNLYENIFLKNTAIYGNETASFAWRLDILSEKSSNIQNVHDRQQIAAKFENIAPGQTSLNITLRLVDNLNQTVATDDYSLAEIISQNNSVVLSGETKKKFEKGIINFNEWIISGIPGSKVMLSIYTSNGVLYTNLKSGEYDITNNIYIEVSLRDCKIGEKESDNKCSVCPAETYSLDPKEGICKACPQNAICYGGFKIVPKKGYWRLNEFSEYFIRCPYKDACIGSSNISNLILTGECKTGYTGNLCNSCEKEYSKHSNYICQRCSGYSIEVFKSVCIILIVLTIFVLIVYMNLKSAYKLKSVNAIYIKIFFNYIQLVMLTANLDLEWPDITLEFLYAQSQAGSLGENFLNFDCVINSYFSGISIEDIYYNKLISMSILPSVMIFIALLVWTLVSMYNYNLKYIKEEFISTMIIVIILIHPNLVKYLFSTLSCKELEPGEYWVRGNYDIECWNDKHTSYILWVVIPGIVIWGILAPAICLAILIQHRRNLKDIKIRLKLGFLFNGYNNQFYYWEFLIMYRKVLIIFCSTFLSSISINIQALTVAIILNVSLYIHLNKNPFRNLEMNEMEKRSNLVAIVTIYCGLYYMTADLNNLGEILLFILIICINTYFIYFWARYMFEAYIPLFRKIPILRVCLTKNLRDDYSPEIFVSHHFRRKTGVPEEGVLSKPHHYQEPQEDRSLEYFARLENLNKVRDTKTLYLLIVNSKLNDHNPESHISQNASSRRNIYENEFLSEDFCLTVTNRESQNIDSVQASDKDRLIH
jgi:hypothetical protein